MKDENLTLDQRINNYMQNFNKFEELQIKVVENGFTVIHNNRLLVFNNLVDFLEKISNVIMKDSETYKFELIQRQNNNAAVPSPPNDQTEEE